MVTKINNKVIISWLYGTTASSVAASSTTYWPCSYTTYCSPAFCMITGDREAFKGCINIRNKTLSSGLIFYQADSTQAASFTMILVGF